MKAAFDPSLCDSISRSGNIAVLVVQDPEDAEPVAKALLDGGVRAIELTFRTAAAPEALRRLVAYSKELIVGAGTILSPEQMEEAARCGAAFAVAPGLNPRVAKAAADLGISYAPGVMTPSEIEQGLELGCTLQKFFPAGVLGGLKTITTMAAPYKHLGVKFIPLGGITPETTAEYLKSPLIAACGGSWIAKDALVKAKDWDGIRKNAELACSIARASRG